MMNFSLQWHPKYGHHFLSSQGALLMSEKDEFFIKDKEYQLLNEVVGNKGTLSDYVFQEPNVALQIARIHRVDELVRHEILIRSGNALSSYKTPTFQLDVTLRCVNGLPVYCLSSLIEQQDEFLAFVCAAMPHSLTLVIVDDYLDPRLADLNHLFRENSVDWLLLKLTGDEPRIGPLFRAGDSVSLCYDCLYSRLVLNKPVREWYRRYQESISYQPTPCRFDLQRSLLTFEYFNQGALAEVLRAGGIFYQHDNATDFSTMHKAVKRPQCKTCGDGQLFGKINHPPIKLNRTLRGQDVDGGYRSVNRLQTLSSIQDLIDPVIGIISELRPISNGDKPELMAIYRAAYYQNSYLREAPSADTFVQLSLGKGVAQAQAQASALGEALERQAAQYCGDEPTHFAIPAALAHRAFPPHALCPYSSAQYQSFSQASGVSLSQPQWVKPYDNTTAIHWVMGWSFTQGECVYFPAAYCFANTPFDDRVYSLYNHNGNAAGNTKEEAILQGALEVIERDAVALWWYNQVPRPEINIDIVPEPQRRIIHATLQKDWQYWLLDISNDLDVTSCVAVGQHLHNEQFVLGFGAHLDPAIACSRALTEMYQLIVIKDGVTGPFDFKAIKPHPFLFPKRQSKVLNVEDFSLVKTDSIHDDILYLIEILKKRDLELCVVNYSRPDLPLKTLKVIIPGLCHFWPQLDNARLYQVPVAMGWLSKALGENDLNPVDLYL